MLGTAVSQLKMVKGTVVIKQSSSPQPKKNEEKKSKDKGIH